MATLPPPAVQLADAESKEKKIYNIIDLFEEYLPVPNDRYRLAASLISSKDAVLVIVKTNKLNLKGISEEEIASRIETELKK